VYPLAIHHDVDGIPNIAIPEPFRRDAVFGDLLARLQGANCFSVKTGEAEGHFKNPQT
jgi:hypothetical protein